VKNFKLNKHQLDNIVNQYSLSDSELNNFSLKKENILISGATGFLATHLIAYLLLDCRIKNIYALVRNKDKLLFNLEHYGIIKNYHFTKNFLNTLSHTETEFIESNDFKQLFHEKVHLVIGDISKENWNIDLNDIKSTIDLVIHLAAKISALDLLKSNQTENCDATYYGTQLAKKFNCSFMLASTLSVFVSSSISYGHFYESDILNEEKEYLGGYAQSKYISEKLTQHYPSQILRYGLLTGSSFYGKFPENTFFELFIQWIQKNKTIPQDYEESFVDITPVDIAALITKELIFRGNFSIENNIYHIANSQNLSIHKLISAILKNNPIKYLSHEEFMLYLEKFKKTEQIFLNYAFFKHEAIKKYPNYFNIDLFQSTHCVYHKDNLEKLHLDYLKNIDEHLINLYLGFYHE
jgi:thioester reductase-like protein